MKPIIPHPSKLIIPHKEPVSIRHFSPLNNKSPSPVVFKQTRQTEQRNPYPPTRSPSVEQIFPKKLPTDRRTVINLCNNPDKPVEHIPTEPFITRETRRQAKTHDCTVCNKQGHDEVHCYNYQCKFCHDTAPGYLPAECLKNPAPFHHHHICYGIALIFHFFSLFGLVDIIIRFKSEYMVNTCCSTAHGFLMFNCALLHTSWLPHVEYSRTTYIRILRDASRITHVFHLVYIVYQIAY